MVRLIQLHVFDSTRNQIVQCEDEPIHIAAAPGCFIVSTASGFLSVYKSDAESTFLYKFKTKNKEIWDLQYSQFDDSLLTIENESEESTIRVVRHYVNWRGISPEEPPSAMMVDELIASRSVRYLAVDSSQLKPAMTKVDGHRRTNPFPFFNILIATDGAISTYRVRCLNRAEGATSTNNEDCSDEEAPFTWVFSVKAQATRIGLCSGYLSYSTATEVFVVHIDVDQASMEQQSLSQICKSAVDGVQASRPKLSHHSIILANTTLSSISEASKRGNGGMSRSNSSTSVDHGSMTLASTSSSHNRTVSRSNSVDPSRTGTLGNRANVTVARSSVTQGFTLTDTRDSVEISQYHHDVVFDKANAIKNKAPYVELPLETRNAHLIGAQGTPLGAPMTPTTGSINQNVSQILGPQHDSNSYVVNRDEDFVLLSAQLLFYRNLAITATSEDSDNFLVLSGQIPNNELESVTINSLALLPIHRSTPSADASKSLIGVRVFVGNAIQGHVWTFKQQELCETATYNFLTECSKTIATDSFLYSLSNNKTILIHLMRQFDTQHSGATYGQFKGENATSSTAKVVPSAKRSNGAAAPSKASSALEPAKLNSKTLVQQRTDPLLVGALDFLGLCQICANSDGKAMILCKSTEDQIAALRDESLAGRHRDRSSSKSAINFDTTLSQRRSVAHGWNLISTNFHSAHAMLEQFKHWVPSEEAITKEDWSILLESWTLANMVVQSYEQSRHPLQTLHWVSEKEYEEAILAKRAAIGKLGQIEYDSNRLLRAAIMWSLSDVPAKDAIDKLMQKLKKGHHDKSAAMTQDACVELLKRVLLGNTQRMDLIDLGSGFADVVYAILILQNAPLVGQVVLESPLDKFDLDTTIVLLEKTMRKLEAQVQGTSDVVSSFLTSAVVLDAEGEVTAKASPLDDFYQSQTPLERQLWMTTLALVVLMLRREEEGAMDENSNHDLTSGPTPDVFLNKLPEAFLVPYLTTHSHLMFGDARKPRFVSNHPSQASMSPDSSLEAPKLRTPSKLAHLLAQTMPWTCLELLVTAGSGVFSPSFVSSLLSSNTVEFTWLKAKLATSAELSASPTPQRNSRHPPAIDSVDALAASSAPHSNPVLFTAYLEAQVLPGLNPGSKEKTSHSPSCASLPNCSLVERLENIKLLASRYIEQINTPAEEVSAHLRYITSDLIMKTNPHNTRPPVSLEGIWKEFHREYLIESRFKFVTAIPPLISPNKSARDHQTMPEHFYLFKLQGLICALHEESQKSSDLAKQLPIIASHILQSLQSLKSSIPHNLDDSIQLLCQPILDGLQGLEKTILRIVLQHPSSLIKFYKKFLALDDMERWKAAMRILLAQVSHIEAETTVWCLEETLKYLARNISTSNFLSLLPDNGNVAFFIPYIELSLSHQASMELLDQIQALK
jgi:hypothetical protein